MNNNNKFILQVFEKIGTPLFASVNDFSARAMLSGQASSPLSSTEQAEIIAKLLTNVTKASASVSSKLELKEKDPESDDLHISMAAILSPVISNMYQVTGTPLNDDDIEKVSESFETIATFSNHFSSIVEGNKRLDNLATSKSPSDTTQHKLKNILGMTPVINSVAAFSFGEEQNKLLKKIIQRIEEEVTRIKKSLPDEAKENDDTSLQLINSISTLYSQCHFAEMARIMSLSDKERETTPVTIDSVWKAFDQRISMLEVLVGSIIPYDDTDKTTSSTQPSVDAEAEEQASKPDRAEPVEDKVSQESNETKDSPTKPAGNPMSFFAGKKSDEDKAG